MADSVAPNRKGLRSMARKFSRFSRDFALLQTRANHFVPFATLYRKELYTNFNHASLNIAWLLIFLPVFEIYKFSLNRFL